MRNFGDAYKHAVNSLPEYHIDISQVKDELHHRKMMSARRKKNIRSVVAACIFLICGAGTATAVNYSSSVIKISENGFSFTGKTTELEEVAGLEDAPPNGTAGGAAVARIEEGDAGSAVPNGETQPRSLEAKIMESREYASIESFREQEDITIAVPELNWLGEEQKIEWQEVQMLDEMGTVLVTVGYSDEVFFSMHQMDVRQNPNYTSSNAYMGTAVNKRTYTNNQGFVYQVFDSEEEGEIISTHAAISINGRDLSLNFFGFDEKIVENVLSQLDLSIYMGK